MDLAINNGFVVDPANGIYSKLNIGIQNGKIQMLTTTELAADQAIDAEGLVVTPGFIDAHMHEGEYYKETDSFDGDIFECMLRMGVTTAIGGNCGGGPEEPAEYLDVVDRIGIPVNLALLVPHDTLRKRAGVLDKYSPASKEASVYMKELAERYLDSGCIGISFGIRYIPGITTQELHTVSSAAAGSRKIIAAHIRDDAANVIPSVQEMIDISKAFGVPVQISHIGSMGGYGQMEALLALLDSSKAAGLDISSDCYPYTAFSTSIGETTYDDGFLERYHARYENIELAEGVYKGKRCTEEIFRELRASAPDTITIAHVMRESEIDMAIAHPGVLIGSDGFMHGSQGHPRAAGTFPRVISEYANKKKLLTLHDAVSKMTWQTAGRFGLNKGGLGVGSDADVVVFSPEELADSATFDNPVLAPEGIRYVLLGGKIALRDGVITEGRLGRTIRK